MNTTKTVQVARTSMWSIGVKNWYVFQDTDGARYQRWSFVMDDSDEVLMLLQVGDTVDVEYAETEFDNGFPKREIVAIEFAA